MYNVCKSLHKLGLSIKRFVKMGSITADQYETITGKKYEQLIQVPRSIFSGGALFCVILLKDQSPHIGPISVYRNRTWGFFTQKNYPPT